MKYRKINIILFLVMCVTSSSLFSGTEYNLNSLVKGNNNFCLELYNNLKDREGNLFFSSYSISTALAMTYAGARGDTEKQIADVLHFPADQKLFHPAFSQLQNDLNAIEKKGDVLLSIANALWAQKGDTFLDSFLNCTQNYYDAGLYFVDFAKSKEARKKINDWVEEKTHDKIKDLIKPPIPDRLTSLILTNAIYFKGSWYNPFEKKKTINDDFYLSKDVIVQVPMMSQKSDYRYIDYGSFEALELPYEGEDLSMFIFLPKAIDGLTVFEKHFSADTVSMWIDHLTHTYERDVIVTIPKFKTTCEFELAPTLSKMGMSDVFSWNADFSGMNGKRDLFISNVIHKAFVDVNEEGTEAAAATAVVMLKSAAPIKPIEFIADHPFLFFIRENTTGSILFVGRIIDPRK